MEKHDGGTGVGHLLESPRTIFLGAMFYCPHAVGRSFWNLIWGPSPALNKVSSWAEAPVIVSSVDRFVCALNKGSSLGEAPVIVSSVDRFVCVCLHSWMLDPP